MRWSGDVAIITGRYVSRDDSTVMELWSRARTGESVLLRVNGVKPWFASPRQTPEIFLGNPFLGDITIKIKVDDIEPALRQDEKAIIRSAPSWGIHPGSGGVG